jgi:hypothetical protein
VAAGGAPIGSRVHHAAGNADLQRLQKGERLGNFTQAQGRFDGAAGVVFMDAERPKVDIGVAPFVAKGQVNERPSIMGENGLQRANELVELVGGRIRLVINARKARKEGDAGAEICLQEGVACFFLLIDEGIEPRPCHFLVQFRHRRGRAARGLAARAARPSRP